jgi:hypothetical protein
VEKWHQELYDLKRLALNRLRRLALNRAFDIGFKLRCWHDLIPHGKWLPWLRANVQIPERTASQYLLLWDHNEEIKSAFNSESADLGELPPIKDALALIANKRAEKRTGEPPSDGIKAKQVVHRIPAAGTSVAALCPESATGQATDHLEQTEADAIDETDSDDQTKLEPEQQPSNGNQDAAPNNGLTKIGKFPMVQPSTQWEMDELIVLARFKKFLREISKLVPANRHRPIIWKYIETTFSRSHNPTRQADQSFEEESPNDYCEVGWVLLVKERDTAVLALTPKNQEWRKSALEFFESLRNRKIVTVS